MWASPTKFQIAWIPIKMTAFPYNNLLKNGKYNHTFSVKRTVNNLKNFFLVENLIES